MKELAKRARHLATSKSVAIKILTIFKLDPTPSTPSNPTPATNRRYHLRLCSEAWHINSAHAPLNRDDGSLLPDANLHLVRKKAAD